VVSLAFAVVYALEASLRRMPRRKGTTSASQASLLGRLSTPAFLSRRVLESATIGAASHLLFDGITHRSLDWFRPWWTPDILPRRAGGPWIWLRLKGLDQTWTLGFYELQWVCWTLLGAVLFAWCLWTGRERSWR